MEVKGRALEGHQPCESSAAGKQAAIEGRMAAGLGGWSRGAAGWEGKSGGPAPQGSALPTVCELPARTRGPAHDIWLVCVEAHLAHQLQRGEGQAGGAQAGCRHGTQCSGVGARLKSGMPVSGTGVLCPAVGSANCSVDAVRQSTSWSAVMTPSGPWHSWPGAAGRHCTPTAVRPAPLGVPHTWHWEGRWLTSPTKFITNGDTGARATSCRAGPGWRLVEGSEGCAQMGVW